MAVRGGLRMILAGALLSWAGAAEAASDTMPTGGRATQPIGHWEFCQTHPAECAVKSNRVAPVQLTRARWAAMVEVNNFVNASILPETDMQIWGREEVWSFPDGVGDCEDYVLEKQRELIRQGFPASSVLITVVRQGNGEGHAVLTVRTDRGDFILDNLQARVLRWSETDYTYLKRQSERSASAWVSITDGRATAVGSVR